MLDATDNKKVETLMTVPIPYGRGQLFLQVDTRQVRAVLKPGQTAAALAVETGMEGHANGRDRKSTRLNSSH